MGSFNTTCFVSNQTIVPGDKVVIIPIIQNIQKKEIGEWSSREVECLTHSIYTTDPNCFWTQFGPVFHGDYADYGHFVLDDTPTNYKHMNLFMVILQQVLVSLDANHNTYKRDAISYDILCEKKEISMNDWFSVFIENCRQFRVCALNNAFFTSNGPNMVSVAVMHRYTYDYLKDFAVKNLIHEDPNDTLNELLIKRFEQKIFSKFVDWEDYKLSVSDSKEKLFEMLTIQTLMKTELFSFHYNCALNQIYGIYYSDMTEVMLDTNYDRRQYIQNILNFCEEYINNALVVNGLDYLNLRFSPYIYCTQDYSNEIGTNFLSLVTYVHDKLKNQPSKFEE